MSQYEFVVYQKLTYFSIECGRCQNERCFKI